MAGGVPPRRTSLTELPTELKEPSDPLRCHGALPKSLREILDEPASSLNQVPLLLMFCDQRKLRVPSMMGSAESRPSSSSVGARTLWARSFCTRMSHAATCNRRARCSAGFLPLCGSWA